MSEFPIKTLKPFKLLIVSLLFNTKCLSAFGGNPSCPCIDQRVWPLHGINASGHACVLAAWGSSVQCFPENYGVGECRAWDDELDEGCSGPSKPASCAQPWCYIDETKCLINSTKTARLTNVLVGVNDAYYSYDTCGGDEESW